jgi:hypothetical protein
VLAPRVADYDRAWLDDLVRAGPRFAWATPAHAGHGRAGRASSLQRHADRVAGAPPDSLP